jgi:hypothetical protein
MVADGKDKTHGGIIVSTMEIHSMILRPVWSNLSMFVASTEIVQAMAKREYGHVLVVLASLILYQKHAPGPHVFLRVNWMPFSKPSRTKLLELFGT